MRDTSDQQIESLVALTPEDLGPHEHPIRRIKPLADRVLQELLPAFSRMCTKRGRPSVPPEHLLKASFLIALYSVRSERQFCERLTYDTRAFVTTCRSFEITPHVAMKQWHSALDRGTEPSRGVRGESAGAQKRVEEVFGWLKTVGGGRKLRSCGVARNGLWAEMALAAYNLVRMAKLMPPPSSPGAAPACCG